MRDGVPVGPGCDTRGQRRGLVAVPVGGGRARAGLEIAGGPPPTGTQSDQTELGRSCAVDGGRIEQPGLTQHAAPGTPVGPHSN